MLRGGELGADLFLINGKMHGADPARSVIAEGERVLIRLINTGAIPHPIHTHGHSFRIVATDGNPVPGGGAVDQGHGPDRPGRALRPRAAWATTPASGWCTATSSTTWPTA